MSLRAPCPFGDVDRSREHLTFVVVGAGPTRVELAGAMVEIAIDALAEEFDHIDPSQAQVVLLEVGDHVLPAYAPELRASARQQLEDLGVDVRTGALVTGIDQQGVTLEDGSRIDARTVLWAARVQASPLGEALGAECDQAGRVLVRDDLSLPGHPKVFVAGDLAAITTDGRPLPGVAPAAYNRGSISPDRSWQTWEAASADRSATATRLRWPRSVAPAPLLIFRA